MSRDGLILGEEPKYTLGQAAEVAAVSIERITQIWTDLALAIPGPDDVVFADADIQALRLLDALKEVGIVDDRTERRSARDGFVDGANR